MNESSSILRSGSYRVGLIGSGITASLTPPMHEEEAAACGMHCSYHVFDLDVLEAAADSVGDLVHEAAERGFRGLNITHPCKQLVTRHLDEISPQAAGLGAVNTVVMAGGRLIGHNTDHSGFLTGLRSGLPNANLGTVLLMGAGGAGAAVSYALLAGGVQTLLIADVDPSRAAGRAAELEVQFPERSVLPVAADDAPRRLAGVDGLVNATPVGMAHLPGVPLDLEALSSRHWVADVVYRPLDTELLQAARARGCAVLDGGRMAVGQAADAFELFTGIAPDVDRMRRHFLRMVDAERAASVTKDGSVP